MKNRESEILYSEPVRELMGTPPRRILRWGTTVLFFILALFLIFAWIIRYPDTITAPAEITTVNPPVTLVSKISGNIKYLYVKDRENVTAGQIVAVMETTASLNEIKLLKETIYNIKEPSSFLTQPVPEFSGLGEIQAYYATFLKNLNDLKNFTSNDLYGSKIASLTKEIRGIREYIARLDGKERLFSENVKIERKKFGRDSALYSAGLIPENDLEKSRQSLIRIDIELQQVRLEQAAKSIEMAEKQQLLQDYRINRIEENGKFNSLLEESFLNLKAQADIWENNYLLVSPVKGTVSFTRFWSANQSVKKDEPVVTIVPYDAGELLGRMNLKMQRSGKVKTGQMIFIKLTSYPYLEYGMLKGVVKSISLLPSGDEYIIEISLPEGLKTLYGINIEFTQKMQGTAEIITEDVRLLQKMINPFRYLISRNKR
jgi:multidrug efflux pump subunit AcrA (membrane-fusion protein)